MGIIKAWVNFLTFLGKSVYNARQNSQEIPYEYLQFCNQCHRQSKKANIKRSWIQKMYRKSDAISGVSQSVMRGQNRRVAGVDSAEVKITNNPMDIPCFPSWSRICCA